MATKQGRVKEIFEVEDKASGKLERIRGAHSKVNQEVSHTSSAFQKARSTFSGFAQTTGIVTTGVMGLATAGFGLLTKNALGGANALQQNALALEVMLGSQEEARKLLQDVSEFASATPFNLTDLQNHTKQLIAFNFESSEIIDTLGVLGNIASGVGTEKLPQIIRGFGQVRNAGKLTGEDLNQLIDANIPILEELGKVLGIATGEVKEFVSTGAVSFQDVQQALENLGGEQGRWGDMMDKQSKTLGGMISNAGDLRDSLFRLAGGIREDGSVIEGGLLDTVSTGMTFLLGFIEENRDTITGFFEQVGKYAGGVVDIIGGLIFAFVEGDAMNDVLGDGLATFGLAKDQIFEIMKVVQGFVDLLSNNTDVIKNFLIVMGGFLGLTAIVGVIVMIVNAINPVFLLIAGLAIAVALLKKAWDSNFMGIRDIIVNRVMPAVQRFFEIAKTKFNEFREVISNVINSQPVQLFISTLKDSFINIIKNVGNIIGMLRDKIIQIIPKIQQWAEKLKPLFDVLMTINKVLFIVRMVIIGVLIVAIVKLVEIISSVLAPILSFIIDAFILVIDVIVNVLSSGFEIVSGLLSILFEVFSTIFGAIWNVIQTVFNIIKAHIENVMMVINTLIIPIIQILVHIFTEQFNRIRQIVTIAINIVRDHIVSNFNRVRDAIGIVFGFIKDNIISPVVGWFMSNIVPRIQTFINIIVSIFNSVKNPVINAFNTIKNRFSEIFNSIKSLAETIWGGITNGIKSGINGMIDAINSFIGGVNDMLEDLDNYGSKIGVNVDFRLGEIPKLATGVNVLPEDTIAMLHKGEAVVPAQYNPYNPNATAPDGKVVNNNNQREIKQTNNFYNYEVDFNSATSKIAFQIKYAK